MYSFLMSFSIKHQCLNLSYENYHHCHIRSLYCIIYFVCMRWDVCLKQINEWMIWKPSIFEFRPCLMFKCITWSLSYLFFFFNRKFLHKFILNIVIYLYIRRWNHYLILMHGRSWINNTLFDLSFPFTISRFLLGIIVCWQHWLW